MATLHDALKALGPVSFSAVPTSSTEELTTYLQSHFHSAQLIVESVPPPPSPAAPTESPIGRSRAATAPSSSGPPSTPTIFSSAARSIPSIPEHAALQKEWGKPLRLSAKENPLGMGVYKLNGKDGRGAWFARRSVHSGLGFTRWKAALEREFPTSLEVQGGPGEGNVRGIGGERRVFREMISRPESQEGPETPSVAGGTGGKAKMVGCAEVYHLSAQFPGPTSPRDFVTLLLTSDDALEERNGLGTAKGEVKGRRAPRHYMIISKPCEHSDCAMRDGYVRGTYESVEFIREVLPPAQRKISSSEIDLSVLRGSTSSPLIVGREAVLQRAHAQAKMSTGMKDDAVANPTGPKLETVSFADSNAIDGAEPLSAALDDEDSEDEEDYPVEWIMITRSDPGGSVPRFMVERGTPAGICTDAAKFLAWACDLDTMEPETEEVEDRVSPIKHQDTIDSLHTDGRLAGLENTTSRSTDDTQSTDNTQSTGETTLNAQGTEVKPSLLSSIAGATYAGIEMYAPQAISSRLPSQHPVLSVTEATQEEEEQEANPSDAPLPSPSASSTAASFASAEDFFSDSPTPSTKSTSSSAKKNQTPYEKELAKVAARKAKLDLKLQRAREKDLNESKAQTEKDLARARKAEEKYAREVAKAQERHAKELKALEEKRARDEKRDQDRKEKEDRKALEKNERGMREALEAEVKALKVERDMLKETVRMVQAENTRLVATVGKLEGGSKLLEQAKSLGG